MSYDFYMHWYFLIYSYYMTVSNGRSLTALSSVKFAQCSGSFRGGVNLKIYPGKSGKWALSTGISLYIPIIWLHRALLFL